MFRKYVPVRLDRDRHGGGVLLYILNCLSNSLVFSGSIDLELIVVSIDVGPSRVALTLFLSPP